jgi:hypothetical protein
MRRGLTVVQGFWYATLAVVFVLAVGLAALFWYYRPSIEFAYVDVSDLGISNWWKAGLLAVCGLALVAVAIRLIRQRGQS